MDLIDLLEVGVSNQWEFQTSIIIHFFIINHQTLVIMKWIHFLPGSFPVSFVSLDTLA
jgi:hypothetical protein